MTGVQRRMIDEGFVSAKDAAAFLNLSKTRIYELARAGVLSHAKHGRRVMIARAAIREYAAQNLKLGSVA